MSAHVHRQAGAARAPEASPAHAAEPADRAPPALDPPLVVAAASCHDVVLRWKSLAPAPRPSAKANAKANASEPVDRYLVQRFPDAHEHLHWLTLVDADVREVVDAHVQTAHEYLYRVQAVPRPDAVRRISSPSRPSVFAYHAVRVAATGCTAPATGIWKQIVRAHLDVIVPLVRTDVLQAMAAVCACLLVVYSVMRAKSVSMQRTLDRLSQLRRLRKATAASPCGKATKSKVLRHALVTTTASDTSTELSINDLVTDERPRSQSTPQRRSIFDSFRSLHSDEIGEVDADDAAEPIRPSTTRPAPAPIEPRPTRAVSLAANVDRATSCAYCHKHFGIFRRRRICSVCQVTALCRKCSTYASAEDLRRSMTSGKLQTTAVRHSTGTSKAKAILIVCRDCSGNVQRYSAAPTVRPSFPA